MNQQQETPITDLMHNATTQQKIINSMKSHVFCVASSRKSRLLETNDTEHCRNLIVIDKQKIFLCFAQSRAGLLINVLFRRLRFSGGTTHVQRTERGKFFRRHIPARPGHIGNTASFRWLLNSFFEA